MNALASACLMGSAGYILMKSCGQKDNIKRTIFILGGLLGGILSVILYFVLPKYDDSFTNWMDFLGSGSGMSYPIERIANRESSKMLKCKYRLNYITGYIAMGLTEEEFKESIDYYVNEYESFDSLCQSNGTFVDDREYSYMPSESVEELVQEHNISVEYLNKLTYGNKWKDYRILLYEYYKNDIDKVCNIILCDENNNSIIHVASKVKYNPLGTW